MTCNRLCRLLLRRTQSDDFLLEYTQEGVAGAIGYWRHMLRGGRSREYNRLTSSLTALQQEKHQLLQTLQTSIVLSRLPRSGTLWSIGVAEAIPSWSMRWSRRRSGSTKTKCAEEHL